MNEHAPIDDLDTHERRVVSVEPIPDGPAGDIDVVAVYRNESASPGQIDRHEFTFGYLASDTGKVSVGLGEWNPPSETVGAGDIAVLEYVAAYFEHHNIQADLSLPFREFIDGEFDADAELEMGADVAERVEQ